MASVSVKGVYKRFGEIEAICGFDLEVADGELVVLVGPSGCGKTTLLRLIAGLETVTSGEIAVSGRIINDLPPKDRDIAMVFQNYALYPHMTVRENLLFGLRARGADGPLMSRRLDRTATMLGLMPLLDRYPRQLSGGQRQRVAMGRAIIREPQVFLFDEPLSNLDANLRVRMRSEIKALQQNLRTTSIYVTHDQAEALTMADRVVVMNRGRVEQIGAPLQIYDHPANRFVAGFIGSPAMNFIAGRVRRIDDRVLFEAASGFRLPLPGNIPAEEGRRVVYGIRPEHVEMTGIDGLLTRVSLVEPTGAITYVISHAGGVQIRSVVANRHPIRPGQEIRLAPQIDTVHVFDEETGLALT